MVLDKNTDIIILLPENPLKTEEFAAEELAYYLRASLGAAVRIADEQTENALCFIIGGPDRNKAAKKLIGAEAFRTEVTGPEGLYIQIGESAVLLAGSDDRDGYNRGTLYAVYEFLERFVGCCFGTINKEGAAVGETVPRLNALVLEPAVSCKAAADLPYRTAIVQYNNWVGNADHELSPAFISWLAKNRYNRILTWVGIYEQYRTLNMIPELEKRGIRLTVGHHQAAATWLPPYGNARYPKQYALTNPEFYRLQEDGTRFIVKDANDYEGQMIFCSRNEELIEEVAKNLNEWIAENPLVDTIAFWPNDSAHPQCCCEKCAPYSKTENYLYLENEIAKRVAAVHPETKIDVLIYMDLWECPKDTVLSDAIVIDESTWAIELRTCGKPDGSCIIGTKFEKNLLRYRERCKNVVFYEYYMGNYGNKQRIMPAADELQSLYQHYKAVGFSGSGTQIECFNLWNNLLNFYCFARTAYDTSLSLEQQIASMCRLFGKGGEPIAKILALYEETLDGEVPINLSGIYFAHHIDRQKVYALFDEALYKAKDATAKNNIRMMRMAFRYTDLSSPAEGEELTAEASAELDYMYTHFNSYLVHGGYGIAIPDRAKTDIVLDDIWYRFEE